MRLLAEIFPGFSRKQQKQHAGEKSNFVFYKIVDLTMEGEYVLQCINTSAIFRIKQEDIIFDIDILYSLHPIQSCYAGIEYAKHLKKENPPFITENKQKKLSMYSVSICRYGSYQIYYQDRTSNVCFINLKTNEETLMDPRDIALSEELIQDFDAAQAFYIGLLAGLKLNNLTTKSNHMHYNHKRPHLTLVKK